MATWQELATQMASLGATGPDQVRRGKLSELNEITGRPVMLYAVDMFNRIKIKAANNDISIDLSDKDGFSEALRNIEGTELDVILHSPGGSPEATESIVHLMRSRFNNIRFIIPNLAKSAATMLAMSGDEIILGDDAELGPTDPQMIINGRFSPALAILKQFDIAKDELSRNNDVMPAWLPILQQYGPSLLVECNNGIALTKQLVKEWLKEYMLNGVTNSARKANTISNFLTSKQHLSHGRMISVDELRGKGVKIKKASEYDPSLSEIIQDINYSIILTFNSTGAYKMFENHVAPGLYKQVMQRRQTPVPATPTG